MPLATSVVATSRTRAVARLAALRRACALGGVSLAVLAPAVQAQTARPSGEVRPDASARQARRAARLDAPVRRIDAGAPQAPLAARPGRVAFAAGLTNPFGIGTPTNNDFNSKPVFADLDGDGDVDLLVGQNVGSFRYYQNTAGPGVTPVYAAVQNNPFGLRDLDTSLASEQSAPAVGDLDGDGDLDVLAGLKSGNLVYFQNTAGPGVAPAFAAPVTNPFGLTDVGIAANTNDFPKPALADLDGDGDMDVLAGRDDGQFTTFENTAGPQATPAFVRATTPAGLIDVGRGAAPAVGDLDGDGDLDVLAGETYGTFFYFENTAGPRAAPVFAAAVPNAFGLPDIGANSAPTLGDADGDGDLDVFAGENNPGDLNFFQNTTAGPAAFAASVFLPGLSPLLPGGGGRLAPASADFDGDGDLDLLIGDGLGNFAYRVNTAGPNATPVYATSATPAGLTDVGDESAPAVGDLDGDGDLDVLSGEYYGGFVYFQNTAGPNATPAFAAASVLSGLTGVGTYSKPALADFDGDGDLDVLAGNYDGQFVYFRNTAGPNATAAFAAPLVNPFGLTDVIDKLAPAVGDLDGDGDLDVLAGKRDGTFVYFRNTAGPSATPAFVAAPMPGGLTDVVFYSTPALADLDGDGDADVLAGSNNNYVQYFRNTSDPGTLTATLTGTEGYRQLAAPTGTPFGDVLGTGIYTQGIAGGDETSGQPTVFRYEETAQGDLNIGYVAPGSLGVPLGIGRGAFVYVFTDEDPRPTAPGVQGGFPKTLQATGRPELTEFDWAATGGDAPLSFTDSPATDDNDGWNLLGNPFGSWFDWDATDLTNVNAPVYVYDNATAGYLTHSRGIPTAGSLPGGIVGPFQGFWVQANAASPAITARPGVASGGPLYRDAAPTVVGLRLRPGAGSALPSGVRSEAFLALGVDGAQVGLSPLDARALVPPAQSYVLLATEAPGAVGTPLAIDARPAPAGQTAVALDVSAVVNGAAAGTTLVLDWPGLALPDGWRAELRDATTGARVDLATAAEYPFTLAGPDAAAPTDAVPALAARSPRTAEARGAGRFTLVVTPAGATDAAPETATALALSAPRPNPTAGGAALTLSLPEAAAARVAIVDVLGREVAVLSDGTLPAGDTVLRLAPAALPAGSYVVRASVGGRVLVQRLTVTR